MSLREHVLATLREGPKTKDEILEAVQQRGYKFSTDNPLNSLGVILYGKNPKLNRVDGKFSLKGGASASSGPSAGGQHQMSAEGRARIAAAQRARWQKSRKDEGTKKAPKGTAATNGTAQTPKRKLSAAGRKAISEAARKRWADAKASGKTAL